MTLLSCSTPHSTLRESVERSPTAPAARVSIVCIVHGDGDYSYHDSTGAVIRADERAIADIESLATRNPSTEVLIVREQPRKSLLFIPRDDETLTYYAGGRRMWSASYRRDRADSRFNRAVKAYRESQTLHDVPRVRMLMYFGHEIPEFGGKGYDPSFDGTLFTIDTLAAAAHGMLADTEKFDLVVLATCYNGSPRVVAALAPYAEYVIASPENLHRSYFDLRTISRLDTLDRNKVPAFAKVFARDAFDNLSATILTAITVAVYDVDRVRPFLRATSRVYTSSLPALTDRSSVEREHCDCADLKSYAFPGMKGGVTLFYRPSRFGRSQHVETHSGWECVR